MVVFFVSENKAQLPCMLSAPSFSQMQKAGFVMMQLTLLATATNMAKKPSTGEHWSPFVTNTVMIWLQIVEIYNEHAHVHVLTERNTGIIRTHASTKLIKLSFHTNKILGIIVSATCIELVQDLSLFAR